MGGFALQGNPIRVITWSTVFPVAEEAGVQEAVLSSKHQAIKRFSGTSRAAATLENHENNTTHATRPQGFRFQYDNSPALLDACTVEPKNNKQASIARLLPATSHQHSTLRTYKRFPVLFTLHETPQLTVLRCLYCRSAIGNGGSEQLPGGEGISRRFFSGT